MHRSVFITDWTQFRALFPVLVVSDEGGYTVVVLAVTRSVAACMCGSSGLNPMGIRVHVFPDSRVPGTNLAHLSSHWLGRF